MHSGQLVFANVTAYLPLKAFSRMVVARPAQYKVQDFSCLDQLDLCLSLFNWAHFRTAKAAVKLYTLIDLKGPIPSFIHISDGKMHDVKVLDLLCEQGYIEAGVFYVMGKAYFDFALLYTLHTARAFFVKRANGNMQTDLIQVFPVGKAIGLVSDHHVRLAGVLTRVR